MASLASCTLWLAALGSAVHARRVDVCIDICACLPRAFLHLCRDETCTALCCRRKLLPRSGASLTYLPAGDGSGEGKVLIYGGQEPVAGAIFDDLLVRAREELEGRCGVAAVGLR